VARINGSQTELSIVSWGNFLAKSSPGIARELASPHNARVQPEAANPLARLKKTVALEAYIFLFQLRQSRMNSFVAIWAAESCAQVYVVREEFWPFSRQSPRFGQRRCLPQFCRFAASSGKRKCAGLSSRT
jgi:hypothetical protein